MLPPMPPPRPRRRRRSYRPLMVLIVAGAVVMIGVMAVVARQRYRQLADASFQRAEELFQSGAFGKAQREYESFRRENPSD